MTFRLLMLFLVGLLATDARAHAIAKTGSWSVTVNSSDLASGAGSDLNSTKESSAGVVTLTLTDIGLGEASYRIDIRKASSSSLSSDVHLWVKRVTDGSGSGSITGGTSYQEVTSVDTSFFSGTLDRSGIQVQYQLTGLGLSLNSGGGQATIRYTIVDTTTP